MREHPTSGVGAVTGYLLFFLYAITLVAATLVGLAQAWHPGTLPRWCPPVVLAAWAAVTAYMTIRPGSGVVRRVNLVPLAVDSPGELVDLVSNVGVFLPAGLLLHACGVRLRWTLLAALAATLGIEVTQYVTDAGRTSDVNDVLCNVTGAVLGWLLARRVATGHPRTHGEVRAGTAPTGQGG